MALPLKPPSHLCRKRTESTPFGHWMVPNASWALSLPSLPLGFPHLAVLFRAAQISDFILKQRICWAFLVLFERKAGRKPSILGRSPFARRAQTHRPSQQTAELSAGSQRLRATQTLQQTCHDVGREAKRTKGSQRVLISGGGPYPVWMSERSRMVPILTR